MEIAINVGALILGAVISWAISHIYYKKITPTELIADQIRFGLQSALFPTLYSRFYDETKTLLIYPRQPRPMDEDVPHVEYARVHPYPPRPGEKPEFLMKVRDTGYDLDNPRGISVRDHKGSAVGVVGLGLGFCLFSIDLELSSKTGPHSITVELVDTGAHKRGRPNLCVQTLLFTIENGLQL